MVKTHCYRRCHPRQCSTLWPARPTADRWRAVPLLPANRILHQIQLNHDSIGSAPQLATARDAMRRGLAWESIGGDPRQDKRVDKRLQDQLTQAQLADARDKAKNT